RQYDGSIIVVSHNRFFLDSFVNKVLEIKNGAATLFEGNISDYLAKIKQIRSEQKLTGTSPTQPRKEGTVAAPLAKGKEARQLKAKLRQERNQTLGPLKKQAAKAEEEIERLEEEKLSLEKALAAPELYQDQVAFSARSKEYSEVTKRLERRYNEWERLQAQVEAMEAEFDETD
ncbi:MAG: ABC transporter ATP-binding protein, partial [Desulfobulbaceae bacterium]|nr:ABC transporter ATP-binding protein [Desulfobulbaceae bacterium]